MAISTIFIYFLNVANLGDLLPMISFVEIAGPLFLLSPSGEISPKRKTLLGRHWQKDKLDLRHRSMGNKKKLIFQNPIK
jgi:hypothetical protein